MNRFQDASTVEEVVGQAIGCGSMCWLPHTGNLEFDSTEASAIVDEAVQRLADIERLKHSDTRIDPPGYPD